MKILKSTACCCRMRPGCIKYHIYVDVLEGDVLMVEEMWKSEADLERHLRSGEYHNLLLVMEMALKRPEVRFDATSTSDGMERIEKARSSCL